MVKSGHSIRCVETREQLALYVRRKWLSLHSDENSEPTDIDDELTNLDWLTNLNKGMLMKPDSDNSCQMYASPSLQEEHSRDVYAKPAHSYTTLIRMAIQQSLEQRATIADIYNWITENFPYYSQLSSQSWHNSVRHTLSLSKCFQKVARNKGGHGLSNRGSFWHYVPDEKTAFRSKRSYQCDTTIAPSLKHHKKEEEEAVKGILENDICRNECLPTYPITVKTEPKDQILDYSQGPIINHDIEICGVTISAADIMEDKDPFDVNLLSPCSDVDMGVYSESMYNTETHNDNFLSCSLLEMSPHYTDMDTAEVNLYDDILDSKTCHVNNTYSAHMVDTTDFSFSDPDKFSSPYKTNYVAHATENLELEEALAFFDC
jgi:hypothetical protein